MCHWLATCRGEGVLHPKCSLWWVVSTMQGKPGSSWAAQGALPASPLDTQPLQFAVGSTNLLSSLLLLLLWSSALPKYTSYNYVFAPQGSSREAGGVRQGLPALLDTGVVVSRMCGIPVCPKWS